MGGYRFLEHISDVIIEAWGKDLNEAFCQAAKAFFDVMVDVSKVKGKVMKKIEVKGFDLQSLLYNWLEELLYLHEVKNLVFSEFEVEIAKRRKEYVLSAVIWGEEYDSKKHASKVAVKAVTYHEMKIESNENVKLRFLLDI